MPRETIRQELARRRFETMKARSGATVVSHAQGVAWLLDAHLTQQREQQHVMGQALVNNATFLLQLMKALEDVKKRLPPGGAGD